MLDLCIFKPQKLIHFQEGVILSIFIIKNYSHSSNNFLFLHILKADQNEGKVLKVYFTLQSIF